MRRFRNSSRYGRTRSVKSGYHLAVRNEKDQAEPSEPEIDLEALMELSTEEQKMQLEGILQNCPRPTEPFVSELLSQLKKLRRLSRPQK